MIELRFCISFRGKHILGKIQTAPDEFWENAVYGDFDEEVFFGISFRSIEPSLCIFPQR